MLLLFGTDLPCSQTMATACTGSTCTFFVTFMPCSSQPAGGKRIGTYQSDWTVSDIYNNIHSKGHTSANYECSVVHQLTPWVFFLFVYYLKKLKILIFL